MDFNFEDDYNLLVMECITDGEVRQTRNGMTRAIFGASIIISELGEGRFPLLTQRQIHYKGVLGELAAFVRGQTILRDLHQWGCNYWDKNAMAWEANKGVPFEDMSIGQVYGAQWTNWEYTGYNQLEALIAGLKQDPNSRRHVITSFSPTAYACIPPCHLLAQFYVDHKRNALDCQVYMRSVDLILGLPSDVVLYSAMLAILANELSYNPGTLIFNFGDTHIYEDHVKTYLMRQTDNEQHEPPAYIIDNNGLLQFKPSDLTVIDYQHSGLVKYELYV